MANASVTSSRIKSTVDIFWSRFRDALQVRDDINDLGGEAFLATVLNGDPDPVPELSAANLVEALTALQAVRDALTLNSAIERIHLLQAFLSPEQAVSRARADINTLRASLVDLRAFQADVADLGGQAWLEAEIGVPEAAKVLNAFTALALINTTLNAGAGARRKSLIKASD